MKKCLFLFLWGCLLAGCANLPMFADAEQTPKTTSNNSSTVQPQSNSIHYYVRQLTEQLFDTANNIDIQKRVAVGTILPVALNSGNNLPDAGSFGLQVQESLTTLSAQAGLTVVEFKTMPNINIKQNYDQMLSRQLEQLDTKINADYFLTGTYSQQQNSLVLNIRLIDIKSKSIIAAATDYMPTNTMWSQSKVISRDNSLYRSEY